MNMKIRLPAFILCASLVSGCATIMNGDMVKVPVTTTPSGATLVMNGNAYISPATVLVPRGKGDFNLHVEKKYFEPVDILLTESLDGWFWGNFIMGGVVGFAVDFITGDAYDIKPELINANLKGINLTKSENSSLQFVLVDISKLPKNIIQRIKESSNIK